MPDTEASPEAFESVARQHTAVYVVGQEGQVGLAYVDPADATEDDIVYLELITFVDPIAGEIVRIPLVYSLDDAVNVLKRITQEEADERKSLAVEQLANLKENQ